MSSRRDFIKTGIIGSVALTSMSFMDNKGVSKNLKSNKKPSINHSVCRWTFSDFSLENLCVEIKKMGIGAIDLIGPSEWGIAKKMGIYSSMCNGAEISLTEGWNDTQYHSTLVDNYIKHIDLVEKAGYKNLICFSGNKRNISNEEGMKNCISGLKKILSYAEKKGVVIQMEVLNSKVDHKDYMADNTTWAFELVRQLGSANFKILYDIYHMQIDEGNIIQTITENSDYIGHYHTAGVPGRNEIEENQELNYKAIMEAIKKTNFKGHVAQEFIPTAKDKLQSLRNAIEICSV